MPSPFPGMDPYLEAYWGDVHVQLITYACIQLNQQLPADLCARAQEFVRLEVGGNGDGAALGYYPDVRVAPEPIPAPGPPGSSAAVAVAVPLVLPLLPPRVERSVRIIDARSGHRVITAIEVLSPSNKVGEAGREAYARKQHDLIDGGVNLVEVDLLRDGHYVLAVPEENVPQPYREPYRVCVVRAARSGLAEVYRVPLQQRLPAVPIPLRPHDADVVLDLQALIDQAYGNGRYRNSIDYRVDPTPPLRGDDKAWAEALLQDKKLRP